MPASAEAGTLLSVPAAGGRPTVIVRDAGAYFDTPCWRADGAVIAHVERAKRARVRRLPRRRRAALAPRGGRRRRRPSSPPAASVVAEVYYAFDDDPQYDGGILIRETGGKEIMRVQEPPVARGRDARLVARRQRGWRS